MAPVLLCPDCGAKHPLSDVNGSAFACHGCGRTLKVPEQARPAAVPAVETSSTRVLPAFAPEPEPVLPAPVVEAPVAAPVAPETPTPRRAARPPDPVPGRWVRFALWIVAVPLAFLIVFLVARVVGVLSSAQVEDVALAQGWGRFLPIARLMPFVALATAGLVHGGVYGITRYRISRRPRPRRAPVDSLAD